MTVRLTHRNTVAVVATVIAMACLAGTAAILVIARDHQTRLADAAFEESTAFQDRHDVVTFDGLGDVHFGDSVGALAASHGFKDDPAACTRTFSDLQGVDPVVADGKLVLMWVNAPVHTPEGITVGSPVSAVRAAYAGGQDLTSTQAYPGILVVKQDKAFLFLHDGKTVQKEIAGYADYVRRLYTEGFGAC
jgi:hypothetical protein